MAGKLSLKPTVEELDELTRALEKIATRAVSPEKKKLELKIKSLKRVRRELIVICGKTYPVYPLPRLKR